MSASFSLMSASITFLDSRLALVHIPVRLYPYFLQPILRVLFGIDECSAIRSLPTESSFKEPRTWMNRHSFFNVSLTPVECSVVCSRDLANEVFKPLAVDFNAIVHGLERTVGGDTSPSDSDHEKIVIYQDDYVAVEVNGQGDAGQRVLELTGPLAMAGIPIFFKTTYHCDYILVPSRSIQHVNHVLEQNGFTFSADSATFSSPWLQKATPLSHRGSSSTTDSIRPTSLHASTPPSTPPATSVSELQVRTFARLHASGIFPLIDRNIRVVSCASHRNASSAELSELKDALLQIFISPDRPSFLSITLTAEEPLALFCPLSLLRPPLSNLLLGSSATTDDDEAVLVPITLDLRDLPMEATGIVCGVAGRVGATGTDLSFLSTARAGTVLVRVKEIDDAVRSLEAGVEEAGAGEADIDGSKIEDAKLD